MGKALSLVGAAVTSAALAGCGSEGGAPPAKNVDPMVSAQQSARYTGDVVRQLGRAISFNLSDGSMVSKLVGTFVGQSDSASTAPSIVSSPLPRPVLGRLQGTPALRSMHPALSVMSQEENFDDTAADLEALLEQRLLAAGNIESSMPTEVTYLLKADPTCRPLPSKIAEGAVDQVDAECAADLAKLEVRIVVSGDGDGYRFRILLGPARHELSVLIVHSDLLGWEADLHQSWQASDYAKMALGQTRDPLPLAKLAGRVKVAVQKLGPEKAAVSFSVLEALDLQGKPDAPFAFAMAKADPVISFTGDGVAETLAVKLGVPATDVRVPWDPRETGALNTDLQLSLGGLHGETTLDEAADAAVFKGIGFAPSFVAVRSAHILDLAFNGDSGNRMDLTVKELVGGGARFEISPRLSLAVGLKLAAVAGELEAMPPAHFMNETYSLVVTGGAPSVVEVGGEMIKVVAGSLSLSTSADPGAAVNVAAGQCLGSGEPVSGAHPLLGAFHAASCQ